MRKAILLFTILLLLPLAAPVEVQPFSRVERLIGKLIGNDARFRVPSWVIEETVEDPERAAPSEAVAARPFDRKLHSFAGVNHGAEGAPGGFCAGISGLEAALYEYAVQGKEVPADVQVAVPELGRILTALRERGDPSMASYMNSSEEAVTLVEAAALRIFTSQEPVIAEREKYGSPDPEEMKRRIDQDGYCILFFGTKYKKVSPWWNVLRQYYANGGHAMLFDGYRTVRVRRHDGFLGAADFFSAVDSNLDDTTEEHPDFGLLNFRMQSPDIERNLWSWMGRHEGRELLALDAYQNGEAYHNAAELLLPPVRFWEVFPPEPPATEVIPVVPGGADVPADSGRILGQ